MSGQVQLEAINPGLFEELKDAFELFDTNGDGHISGKELGNVLRALGQNPTEAMIQEVLKKADKDGDEKIMFEEYTDLLKDNLKDPVEVEIELREAFRIFDKNRDNTLNLGELRKALMHVGECLSPQEAKEFSEMMDTDGDGNVDVDEFVKFMCKRY